MIKLLAESMGFSIFGFEIKYYGIIIALGMAIGIWLACKNAKTRGLTSNDIFIVACFIIPLAIIGARLYYYIFAPAGAFNSFWEIFNVRKGGLAIYGGVIGGTLGIGLYSLIFKKNFFDVTDIATPTLILGQAIGRIGCYFGGCCYGIEVTNPNLMWFPFSVQIDGVWHLSTMFYESIWNFGVFLVLMLLLRKFKIKQRGAISAWYLILYGTGRAWIEALRGDSLYIGAIKVSQLLSILLIVAGIAILVFYYVWNKKHPKKEEKQENIVIKKD